MRYNIFFRDSINLNKLPKKEQPVNFLETLVSDKVVKNSDVLVSEFLQMVSMELSEQELKTLKKDSSLIIETPQALKLLTDISINGEAGWSYPNQWSELINGVDYFYNNPDANPSTHNYLAVSNGVTGEIIPTQIDQYNIKKLWNLGFKGQNVKVAVIDTGCGIGQHPDVEIAGGVNTLDASANYNDTVGHGTAMASIIGSRKNGTGIVGFAPLVSVYSVKVIGASSNNPLYGITDSLLAGLEWCFLNDIDVINISLSFGSYSEIIQTAINKLVEKGVYIVCACGNGLWSDPLTPILFPAGFNGVFSISGKRGGLIFNSTENITFTNLLPAPTTNKTVDYLIEPWIVEATINGSFAKAGYGSSECSAEIAGIFCLIKQIVPFNTPEQTRTLLNQNTITGTHGYKYFQNFDFLENSIIPSKRRHSKYNPNKMTAIEQRVNRIENKLKCLGCDNPVVSELNNTLFPTIGKSDVLYVDETNETIYFWDGAAYQLISSGGGGGETNTSSNVGTGEGLALAKVGVDLPFKTLKAGSNITLTPSSDELLITASGGGGGGSPFVTDILVNSLTVGRGSGNISSNTAIGTTALAANTSGSNNTALGFEAFKLLTIVASGVAIGSGALSSLVSGGTGPTAVGFQALKTSTTGVGNTAIGHTSLTASTTGTRNTALGYRSGLALTTASHNVILGYDGAINLTTGSNNIIIGSTSAKTLVTGNNNVILGYNYTTGEISNTFLVTDGGGSLKVIVDSSNNMGLGVLAPDPSAKLDVTSTSSGILFPRMTTVEKNAIPSPASGLVVYDTTLGKLCVRGASTWEVISST